MPPFSKFVDLEPKFAPAHGHLGGAYARLGRWDKALAELGQAAELDRANHRHAGRSATTGAPPLLSL
jgi:Flp pilus assembly protein TadD